MSEVVLVALIGVAGTFLAALVAAHLTRAADDRRARQARRMELYLKLNRVAIREQRMLDRLAASPYESVQAADEMPGHWDAITAEVDLVAGPVVWQAWQAFINARDTALWNFEQDHPEPDPEIPCTDPDWIRLSRAAKSLRNATRTEADDALRVWQRTRRLRSGSPAGEDLEPHDR
ncbi:MAG: hypothetical protein WA892_08160 [Ornithinimicrobium sp.]